MVVASAVASFGTVTFTSIEAESCAYGVDLGVFLSQPLSYRPLPLDYRLVQGSSVDALHKVA